MANSVLACFKYIENEYVKTAWGLGEDGEVERLYVVFNTSFRYASSWYTL